MPTAADGALAPSGIGAVVAGAAALEANGGWGRAPARADAARACCIGEKDSQSAGSGGRTRV